MNNQSKLNFIISKIESFSELSNDEKVKESVTDLADAISDETNPDAVPKAADKVMENIEEKCVTFSDRCAASDIIKVLKSFSGNEMGDLNKIIDNGKPSEELEDSIPSEASVDMTKVSDKNFARKSPSRADKLNKAGKILKKALTTTGASIQKINAAEKLMMKFRKPSEMVRYLKATYPRMDHLKPWNTKADKAIKKFQNIPDDNETLYRAAMYDYCNTGLGLATIYDTVPSVQSFFRGIVGLNKEMKGAMDVLKELEYDDGTAAAFSDSTGGSVEPPPKVTPPPKATPPSSDKDSKERESFWNRVKNWFTEKGEAFAKNEAVVWIKENPAKASAIGVSVATVVSFLSMLKKIGTLKERLRNTDDPEERALINKKLRNMKLFLTAMTVGTAVTGALAARSILKDNAKEDGSGFWKPWKKKEASFSSYDFEDEIGAGEDDSSTSDDSDIPPVDDAEGSSEFFSYDFEDEEPVDGSDDGDAGDEHPSDDTPVESDPESKEKLDDIKDAEVAIGPGKLTEFSKNLRRFVNDPTNGTLRRKVLAQFSDALDEAVYDANFAAFNEFAEDPNQQVPPTQLPPQPPVAPVPPAPAGVQADPNAVPPAPPALPAGAPVDPNAAQAMPPADPNASVPPVDPNAVPPAPAAGGVPPAVDPNAAGAPVDPNAAAGAPVDPNAAPAQEAQGDGTSESDIVIDKREVQNFSASDSSSYGSYMAKFAKL